uniref:transposase n=1 Tax=Leyella stercorea TaxID=363265 RepID=UPI004028934F
NNTLIVTFRLADSLPKNNVDEFLAYRANMIKEEKRTAGNNTRKAYDIMMMRKMEYWLNNGYGNCILRREDVRNVLVEALYYYNNKEYLLHTFVVMPNHVHILLSLLTNKPINNIIGKVKGFTTFQLRKSLGINEDIWQKGIFDRILRNWDEFEKYVDYIANNPKSLPEDSYSLYIQESIR